MQSISFNDDAADVYMICVSSLWQKTTADFYKNCFLPKFKTDDWKLVEKICGEAITIPSLLEYGVEVE